MHKHVILELEYWNIRQYVNDIALWNATQTCVCVPIIMSDKTFPLTPKGNKRQGWSEKTSNSHLKK